jgi:ankyrin repeat protein
VDILRATGIARTRSAFPTKTFQSTSHLLVELEEDTMADNDIQQQALDKLSEGDVAGLRALLTSSGLDVNACDSDGMTLLQHASYKGKKDIVEMLIDRGADVNSTKHEHNYSALHFAALSGNF